jgi:hypothetical protein
MKTFIVEVVSNKDERLVYTISAPTIEEARDRAVRKAQTQSDNLEWTDASSAEVTSDSTHTS